MMPQLKHILFEDQQEEDNEESISQYIADETELVEKAKKNWFRSKEKNFPYPRKRAEQVLRTIYQLDDDTTYVPQCLLFNRRRPIDWLIDYLKAFPDVIRTQWGFGKYLKSTRMNEPKEEYDWLKNLETELWDLETSAAIPQEKQYIRQITNQVMDALNSQKNQVTVRYGSKSSPDKTAFINISKSHSYPTVRASSTIFVSTGHQINDEEEVFDIDQLDKLAQYVVNRFAQLRSIINKT